MRRAALALSLMLVLTAGPGWASSLDDGMRMVKAGAYEDAIPLLQQAGKANPDDPRPHDLLREAYEGLLRPTDAMEASNRANDIRKRLAKAAMTKAPIKPVNDEPLPPVYVRPGPRTSLPAVTNDNLPKAPTSWKATPFELPVKPTEAKASDATAAPAPAPTATPVPRPNAQPVTQNNPLPYDPGALEPLQPQVPLPELPR